MSFAVPLDGKEARIATLRAKISVARLRAEHGATKAIRVEQAQALKTYEAALAAELENNR